MSPIEARAIQRGVGRPVAPVIRVTSYDRVWSTLVAVLTMLLVSVWMLFLVWGGSRPHVAQKEQVIELIEETSGGVEGGSPTESLKLDGTGPERADASPSETNDDARPEVEEVLASVSLESSENQAAEAVTSGASDQLQLDVAPVSSPKGGRSLGTGNKPALGGGPGSRGGWPRDQRWYVHFSDRGSLAQYAQELDFFGIELGALQEDHTMVYLSQLASAKPVVRRVATGDGEKRLFFTWQGGQRRQADASLFTKAGVVMGPDTIIFHFYPAKTENALALKERAFRNRPLREIRRTFFAVVPNGNGFDFEVSRQAYY